MVERSGVVEVEQLLNLDTQVRPGHGFQAVFGQRTAIPVDAEVDLWRGSVDRRPLPLTEQTMEVVSTDAADSFFLGTGAMLMFVGFIDEFGDWRQSDLIPLNGTTPAAITYKPSDGILGDASRQPATPSPPGPGSIPANIFRVQDAVVVIAAGATEAVPFASNLGNISVQGTGGGTVFELIPAGAGRSRSAAFHCPRNCTARLVYSPAATERGRAELFIGANFGLGTAWQELPIAAINDDTVLFDGDPAVTPIAERADIQARAKVGTNNIDIFWLLQFRLDRIR
jgi:hypothetical protein